MVRPRFLLDEGVLNESVPRRPRSEHRHALGKLQAVRISSAQLIEQEDRIRTAVQRDHDLVGALVELDQGGGEAFDGTAEELFEKVVGSRKQ